MTRPADFSDQVYALADWRTRVEGGADLPAGFEWCWYLPRSAWAAGHPPGTLQELFGHPVAGWSGDGRPVLGIRPAGHPVEHPDTPGTLIMDPMAHVMRNYDGP